MKRKHENLAALAAGGELSPAQQRQWERTCTEDPEARHLAAELARQRESLLLLKPALADQGEHRRTQSFLRDRILSDQLTPWTRWPRWAFVGGAALAGIALAFLGMLAVYEASEPTPLPVAARIYPLPPPGLLEVERSVERKPAVTPQALKRPPAVTARAAERKTVERDTESPRTAMLRVDEVIEQEDGSLRLRLQTRNPNVVIYLVQGGPMESGGE